MRQLAVLGLLTLTVSCGTFPADHRYDKNAGDESNQSVTNVSNGSPESSVEPTSQPQSALVENTVPSTTTKRFSAVFKNFGQMFGLNFSTLGVFAQSTENENGDQQIAFNLSPVPGLPCDSNGDGRVNGADLDIWQQNYGSSGVSPSFGDCDFDNDVDGNDFLIWQRNYGNTIYDFTITAPTGTITTSTTTIQYTESFGAFGYNVYVATDAACTNFVESHVGIGGLSQNVGPLANGTYYACVFADNPDAVEGQGFLPEFWPAKNNGLQFVVDAAPVVMEHIVFITSSTHNINASCEASPDGACFGGHNSADYICTFKAWESGLLPNWDFGQPIYKALISTASVSAKMYAPITAKVVKNNPEHTVLANNSTEFWDGALDSGITHNELGAEVPVNTTYWSGSNQFGDASTSCSNWTSNAGQGRAGSSHITSNWFNQFGLACNQPRRLLCMSPAQPE